MMEDVGDRALGGAVEPVGGAFALLRHAHVERAVGLKGKAACPAIDLHRRYADVEDDAVDRLDAALREQSVDLTEAAADQGEATVRFGDQRLPFGDRVGIAVAGDPLEIGRASCRERGCTYG